MLSLVAPFLRTPANIVGIVFETSSVAVPTPTEFAVEGRLTSPATEFAYLFERHHIT
jgi:hypothetical protein